MRFEKNSYKGKIVISQSVIMKVLGISDIDSKIKKLPWIFDIKHCEYGKIGVRQSLSTGTGRQEGYKFSVRNQISKRMINNTDCDTYFFIGFDTDSIGLGSDLNNIERVYIVPNKGWIKNIGTATIYKNMELSKYNEFKVDEAPYNDALHDLISYTKGARMIDIDDIKKWLKGDMI